MARGKRGKGGGASAPPPKLKGMLGSEPRVSFTQLMNFIGCAYRWFCMYSRGLKETSPMLLVGQAAHECMALIHKAAKEERSLAPQDVSAAMAERAGSFQNYGYYLAVCRGLQVYAEKLHDEIGSVKHTELKLMAPLAIRIPKAAQKNGEEVVVVTLEGRADRVNENEMQEPIIVEGKTVGEVPTEDELMEDVQTSIYVWIYRRQYDYHGMAWKQWHSLIHNVTIGPVPADEDDAEAVEAFVVGKCKSMMLIAAGVTKPTQTTNGRCFSCPVNGECEAWRRECRALTVEGMVPRLSDYARLRGRHKAVGDAKDRLHDVLVKRVEDAGGVLYEGGQRAELVFHEGGTEVSYVRKPWSSLIVKLSKGDKDECQA